MKYRRKPVTVEAIIWDGTNDAEVREFVAPRRMGFDTWDTTRQAYLYPPHSGRGDVLHPNDAIVKDPGGGFSVVSAAVFSRDYDAVEEGL